jgi:hypothetical protein
MAKKTKKRRAWTATEVRELKSLAKKKDGCGKNCEEIKEERRSDATKGV